MLHISTRVRNIGGLRQCADDRERCMQALWRAVPRDLVQVDFSRFHGSTLGPRWRSAGSRNPAGGGAPAMATMSPALAESTFCRAKSLYVNTSVTFAAVHVSVSLRHTLTCTHAGALTA